MASILLASVRPCEEGRPHRPQRPQTVPRAEGAEAEKARVEGALVEPRAEEVIRAERRAACSIFGCTVRSVTRNSLRRVLDAIALYVYVHDELALPVRLL